MKTVPHPRTNLPSLTAMRGFAALAVLVWHTRSLHQDGLLAPLFRASHAGVAVFFVLSGFVLAWTYDPTAGKVVFLRKRMARVLPSHLFVMLLAVVLVVITYGPSAALARSLPAAGLLQSWIPSSAFYFAPNSVSWSLSCEAFFYIAFPFLYPALARAHEGNRRAIAVVAVIAVAVLQLTVFFVVDSKTLLDDNSHASWLVYILPISRLPEFVVGVCAGISFRRGRPWAVTPKLAWIVAGLCLYIAGCFPTIIVSTWLLVLPVALLLSSCAVADASGCLNWLASRPLQYAGRLSFAFYLVQLIYLNPLAHLLGDKMTTNVIAFVAALATAVIVHHGVELPLERRLRPARRRRVEEAAEPTITASRSIVLPKSTTVGSSEPTH